MIGYSSSSSYLDSSDVEDAASRNGYSSEGRISGIGNDYFPEVDCIQGGIESKIS